MKIGYDLNLRRTSVNLVLEHKFTMKKVSEIFKIHYGTIALL